MRFIKKREWIKKDKDLSIGSRRFNMGGRWRLFYDDSWVLVSGGIGFVMYSNFLRNDLDNWGKFGVELMRSLRKIKEINI